MNKHLVKNKRHSFIKNNKKVKKITLKTEKQFLREQIEKEEKKQEEINKKEKLKKEIDRKMSMRELIEKMQDVDLSSSDEE